MGQCGCRERAGRIKIIDTAFSIATGHDEMQNNAQKCVRTVAIYSMDPCDIY